MFSKLSIVAAMFACCHILPVLADEKAKYVLREDTSQTGSSITRRIITGTTPLNFSYEQLSEEDKLRLRSDYEAMAPDDEPPYPLRGLAPFLKAVHEANRHLGERGKISLTVTVDSEGVPRNVAVYETTSPEMGRFAANVALQQKFKPALCKGKPCTMDFLYEVTMEVKL